MKCAVKETTRKYEDFIDKVFSKTANKINEFDKYNLIGSSKLQKDFSDTMVEFQASISHIHDVAGDLQRELNSSLLNNQSEDLVKALNGDLNPLSLDKNTKIVYELMRSKIDENASQLVSLGILKEQNSIKHYLKRFYKQHNDEKSFFSKMYFNQRLKKRKNLSYDERVAMGMIEDASIVIPKTLSEQRIQILKANILSVLAKKFAKETEFKNSIKVSDETMGGGVHKYGALSGKYISKELMGALKNASLAKETLGIMEHYWYPIVDHIKVNVTVKNPVTHLYNVGSNIVVASVNGDLFALAKVFKMIHSDKKAFKALIQRANKYGLGSSLNDFESVEAVFDKNQKNLGKSTLNLGKTIVKNLYFAKNSKAGTKLRNLYDWEDKIFKLACFQKLLDEGMEERKAFKTANEPYVDYSTPLPATIRILDKSGLFPFLHYSYKATPATAKLILKHPIRYSLVQVGLMGAGASAWFGNPNEDLAKPSWASSVFNLFGAKEWVSFGGGSWFLNLGRMVPGMKFGGVDLSLNTGLGFIGSFVNIANGKTPLGYNISKKYDKGWQKLVAKLLTATQNFLPPLTFGRYGQRFAKKALGGKQKNYYNEPMSYGELGARALGVRKFNQKKELETKERNLTNAYRYEEKNTKLSSDEKQDNEKQFLKQKNKIENEAQLLGFDLEYKPKKAKNFGFSLARFDF